MSRTRTRTPRSRPRTGEEKALELAWEEKKRPMEARAAWNSWDLDQLKKRLPNPHLQWLYKVECATGDRRIASAIEAIKELGLNTPGWEKAFKAIDVGPVHFKHVAICRRVAKLISGGKSERQACQVAAADAGFPGASFSAAWRALRAIYKAGPPPRWGDHW